MRSYALTEDALAFRLDHYISTRTNRNIIDTEFELYFQSINRHGNENTDNQICHLKTMLRHMCRAVETGGSLPPFHFLKKIFFLGKSGKHIFTCE